MSSKDCPQVRVRLRPELLAWVKAQAAQNYSSLNGEIARRLEEARLRIELSKAGQKAGDQTAGVASQA